MVYIVTDGSGYVKIGTTKDIYSRLLTLQTGNPRMIKLVMSIETDSIEHDKKLEKILHGKFRNFRVVLKNGTETEWFKSTILDALSDKTLQFWANLRNEYGIKTAITINNTRKKYVIGDKREERLRTTMRSVNLYGNKTNEPSFANPSH